MKLIVTIPAYNEEGTIAEVIREIPRQILGIKKVEVLVLDDGSVDRTVLKAKEAGADYIISHKKNKGLAISFKDAVTAALWFGADIIVNTDADNHYDQSRIADLIDPILKSKADIVIANRCVRDLNFMPKFNKYGNMIGNYFVSKVVDLPRKFDVSSGFRAYTKEAAMKINILSKHTYTHESIIQALDHDMLIAEVPIKARLVRRKSKLIRSIPSHIAKSLIVIVRSFTIYKPLRVMSIIGSILFGAGLIFVIRFLYYFFAGNGSGHIQSLILAAALMMIGFQVLVIGLLGSAIGWNRKLLEEILYKIKRMEFKK